MAMETRTLGRTGIEVGVIGLGTEHLLADRKNMNALLDLAVSGGVNYIDLFSDPSSGNIDEYIEAIGPAVQPPSRTPGALHPLGSLQRAVRAVPGGF